MTDGNDSLGPGLGGHPEISAQPGLSPFTLASFLFQEICLSPVLESCLL